MARQQIDPVAHVGLGECPSGHVELGDRHPVVYCIGDVHGDLRALLHTLRLAGLVAYDEDVARVAEACPSNAHDVRRDGFPLTREQVQRIQWTGGRNAAVLLGDVLDNRRSRTQDIYGVCAHAGTQPLILEIIGELQTQARLAKGKLVLVLGNHDVANAVPGFGKFCADYAPQLTTYARDRGGPSPTCAGGGFTPEHRAFVRERLRRLRAVACVRIHWPGGSILGVHGGLCTLDELAARLPAKYRPRRGPDEAVANVCRLNLLYADALRGVRAAVTVLTDRDLSAKLPTWCRPRAVTDPDTLRAYFGTARMVVAHTVQSHANCTGLAPYDGEPERSGLMPEAAICFTDVGMSRAFESTRHVAEVVRFRLTDRGVEQSVLVAPATA